jgi:hypothetical protein
MADDINRRNATTGSRRKLSCLVFMAFLLSGHRLGAGAVFI